MGVKQKKKIEPNIKNECQTEKKKKKKTRTRAYFRCCRRSRPRRPFVVCVVTRASCSRASFSRAWCCCCCCYASCWRLLLLFVLALRISFCRRNSGRVGLGQVIPTRVAQNFKKKKCYSAITAIPQRPSWLWRSPYETRNTTTIWWHFFENSRRHTAITAF